MAVEHGMVLAKQVFALFGHGDFEGLQRLRNQLGLRQKPISHLPRKTIWEEIWQPRDPVARAHLLAREVLYLFSRGDFSQLRELYLFCIVQQRLVQELGSSSEVTPPSEQENLPSRQVAFRRAATILMQAKQQNSGKQQV